MYLYCKCMVTLLHENRVCPCNHCYNYTDRKNWSRWSVEYPGWKLVGYIPLPYFHLFVSHQMRASQAPLCLPCSNPLSKRQISCIFYNVKITLCGLITCKWHVSFIIFLTLSAHLCLLACTSQYVNITCPICVSIRYFFTYVNSC